MRLAAVFFLSIFILLPSTHAFAKVWVHPDRVFSIEYPDWMARDQTEKASQGYKKALIISDAKEESLARCSFRATAYHSNGAEDADTLITKVLEHPEETLLAPLRRINPAIKYVSKSKEKTRYGQPMALVVFDETLFYRGQGFPKRSIIASAFNTDREYGITMQCTDLSSHFDKDSFIDIFESLVIIPKGF